MIGLDREIEEFERFRSAADRGDISKMLNLASLSDGEEEKYWLRRASDAGNAWSADCLATLLAEEGRLEEALQWYQRAVAGGLEYAGEQLPPLLLTLGRLDEAEQWARQAMQARPVPSNQYTLAQALVRLGRLDEAERWARLAANDRPPYAHRLSLLADILERQGERDEAQRLRAQAKSTFDGPDLEYLPAEPETLVAVASVGVGAFVTAVMTEAGKNSYAGARTLMRWLFRRGQAKKSGYARDRILIVEDPDPKLKVAIWLGTDTPDEQLHAIKDLDLEAVVSDAKRRQARGIRIQWDATSKSWKVVGQ